MTINLDNFLHSLALFMVAGVSGLVYATIPRGLWIGQAKEGETAGVQNCADPYSSLILFGGPVLIWSPLPRRAIQVKTTGIDHSLAMAQAQKLYETLLDGGTGGYPLQMFQIAGKTTAGANDGHWRLVSVELQQPPALIDVDERNRGIVVFNFEVGFFKEA